MAALIVTDEGRNPGLVVGDPARHAVAEPATNQLGVVGECVHGRRVSPATAVIGGNAALDLLRSCRRGPHESMRETFGELVGVHCFTAPFDAARARWLSSFTCGPTRGTSRVGPAPFPAPRAVAEYLDSRCVPEASEQPPFPFRT